MSSGNRGHAGSNNFSMDCNMGDNGGVFSSSNTNQANQHFESHGHPPIRETGIIEKLLVSVFHYFYNVPLYFLSYNVFYIVNLL